MKLALAVVLMLLLVENPVVFAGAERIYVSKEINDDHIIIMTESGQRLLLEKWNLRFSPLLFEGKSFLAEVSSTWVTIHFSDREPIKWWVKEVLGASTSPLPKPTEPSPLPRKGAAPSKQATCYETMVREPAPFLANGGELILLADGSVWKEISYQYLYLYEYYPSVILCPGQGKLILGKHILQVVPMR